MACTTSPARCRRQRIRRAQRLRRLSASGWPASGGRWSLLPDNLRASGWGLPTEEARGCSGTARRARCLTVAAAGANSVFLRPGCYTTRTAISGTFGISCSSSNIAGSAACAMPEARVPRVHQVRTSLTGPPPAQARIQCAPSIGKCAVVPFHATATTGPRPIPRHGRCSSSSCCRNSRVVRQRHTGSSGCSCSSYRGRAPHAAKTHSTGMGFGGLVPSECKRVVEGRRQSPRPCRRWRYPRRQTTQQRCRRW
mmetsp:Transcript_88606/g.229931  ORF Transcript_88606/g.229931 Transcript_88606/m.229931 type:complete len:253 (-) Transcript_88606:1088-1846(-)